MNAQQLKNSILQMAVQGKLVPQEPNDEPASVLLERIRAEKEKLIREGKIKKEKNPSYIFRGEDNLPYEKVGKNEPVCIEDEVPFEIPDSWAWVRLGTLMKVISDGTHKTPNYVEQGIPFLSVQNISKGYFDLSRIKYITQEEHEKLIQRVKPENNDILICRIGTLGKAIKCTVDFEFSIFVSLGLLRPVDYCLSDYVVFAINSPLGDRWIQDNKVGGGTHTYKINLVDLPNMLIPLPPLQEQQRIFAKIEELQPSLSEYNRKDQSLVSLNDEFPKLLKKSILQQAVMGKLIPQDPNDEPASVLLEKIRAEKNALIKAGKLKKVKHESIIYRKDNSYYEKLDSVENCIDDEIPFDIPLTWEWCRLGSLVEINLGFTYRPQYTSQGVRFLSVKDISSGTIDFSKTQYVSQETYDNASYGSKPQKGDILFGRVGTIGKPQIIKTDEKFCIFVSLGFLRDHTNQLVKEYICAWMESPLFWTQEFEKVKGSTVKNLNTSWLRDFLVPIPPLEEQKRITSKIEELSHYCEHLIK